VNQVQRAVRTNHRRFGVLCVLGYVTLAWVARFDVASGGDEGKQNASLLYPFDTFSMYAPLPSPEMSYLLVRDGEGAVHQVTDFASFDCPETELDAASPCPDRRPIQYLYDELVRHVRNHPGPGSSDADLILRTWRVRSGQAAEQLDDCVIAHCRVTR
jgi:hypothetical protein